MIQDGPIICVHSSDPRNLNAACPECGDRFLLAAMSWKRWRVLQSLKEERASWPPSAPGTLLGFEERGRRDVVERQINEMSSLLGDYTPPTTPPPRYAPVLVEPHVESHCGPAWCDSPAEHALMLALAVRGLSFEQQRRIGGYVVDFAFPEQKLVLEVDGFEFHDRTPEQAERDKKRDRELMLQGWRVARFSGREAVSHSNQCATEVIALLALATTEPARP